MGGCRHGTVRTTTQAADAINRMGTDVHVQRLSVGDDGTYLGYDVDPLNLDVLDSDEQNEGVPADPEALAQEIEQLSERVGALEAATAEPSMANKASKAATKGTVGAVGGLLGAAAGTAIMPGVGTIGGAAVGQEIAKGVAGDVTKMATDQAYEKGPEAISSMAGSAKQGLEQFVENNIEEMLGGADHGASSKTDF
ncbi:hypothetical protein [Halomicrobium katesii]|uniref:hypothetical protein n=1 Tax=Halomicrobium katesii TaxID=437163 RepID=UPI00036AD99C|nr:hypothetical protein [Halomicrobium katesii]